MVQSLGIQKLVSKITGIWNFRQALKSPKLKFDGLFFKKYIPSAKTYTVDLSNII